MTDLREWGEVDGVMVYVRDWPRFGMRLFSVADGPEELHLSYDEQDGQDMPAILCKIDWAGDVCTVVAVSAFTNDADALAWYMARRKGLQ